MSRSKEMLEQAVAMDDGKTVMIDLDYPSQDKPLYVEVGLSHVRAADNIRISYDFHRDGYVIEQAKMFCWECDQDPDPEWTEVAFCQAWQMEDEERNAKVRGE